MLKHAIASKRDKGDFTPSTMLKQVIGVYESLHATNDAAGLHAFFLEMAQVLGPEAAAAHEAAELYVSTIKSGREEAVILSAQSSLRASLAGAFDKVCAPFPFGTRCMVMLTP